MKLLTESYLTQANRWPKAGRHILAQFDDTSVVVYPAWKQSVTQSSVRLQWDPDHDPSGAKQERRAIQLGLRGEVLAQYARDWIVNIEDISEFVQQQYQYVQSHDWTHLMTPHELVYPVQQLDIAKRLGLSKDGP